MFLRRFGTHLISMERQDSPATGVKLGSDRVFGLFFAGVFLIVAIWPILHGNEPRLWPLPVSAAFLAAALLRPSSLRLLNLAWFRLGALLHVVMTPVIMAVLFTVLFIPTGFLLRLFGRDPLRLKPAQTSSYWIPRDPPGPAANSLRNQF